MCKHDQTFLMGTADGIVCRGCGRLFKNFDEVLADRGEIAQDAPQAPAEPQEKPKRAPRKKKEDA